jgi:hypothetical protein
LPRTVIVASSPKGWRGATARLITIPRDLIKIILGEAYTAACMFNGYLAGRERVVATRKFVETRNKLNELANS